MGNLGIPKLKLELYRNYLPNVGLKPEAESFDVNAAMMWENIKNTQQEKPSNIEFVGSEEYKFGALFPARSHVEVNNYISGYPVTSALADKRVVWEIRTSSGVEPAYTVGPGLSELITNRSQEIRTITGYNAEYVGPKWEEVATPKSSAAVESQQSPQQVGGQQGTALVVVKEAKEYYSSVRQTTTRTDVWWCIETHSLKQKAEADYSNMPFYLDIERKQPQAKDQETFLMIRINPPEPVLFSSGWEVGKPDIDNSFDILLVDGQSPKILDWNNGLPSQLAGAVWKPAEVVMQIEQNLSAPNNLRIGFLPILGKLAVYFNDEYYLYSRVRQGSGKQMKDQYNNDVDNGQAFLPFKFLPKVVRVVGSNCQAIINLSAMGFAKGSFSTLMPATERLIGSVDGANFAVENLEKLFILPKENGVTSDGQTNGFLIGVCAQEFRTGTSVPFKIVSDNPAWTPRGIATMSRVESPNDVTIGDSVKESKGTLNDSTQKAVESKGKVGKIFYYQITLEPTAELFAEDSPAFGPTTISNIGPPFFFRIRGGYRKPVEEKKVEPIDATEHLISFSETFGSSDRNCVEHSVDLTLYSPSGIMDELLTRGLAVVLSIKKGTFGGDYQPIGGDDVADFESSEDDYEPIFTGISMGGTRTEIAGKETISIKCEDYMIILKHTLMINSPFYDGMDLFNAVYDLAGRAGITPIDDTPETNRYFLPMGYSFTSPAMRFGASTNTQENIKQITAMGERVVYFDNYGVFHMEMLQGGLIFNTASTVPISYYFQSDPEEEKNVIIDEKRTESTIASTVNGIVVKTIDATNNAILLIGDDATNDEGYVSVLPYKKILFRDQPAFGSYRAAVNWINMAKERIYKPIYGITIKIFNPETIIPLRFMRVDGGTYRISSFQRAFNAEDNSHTGSLTGEWMGKLTSEF